MSVVTSHVLTELLNSATESARLVSTAKDSIYKTPYILIDNNFNHKKPTAHRLSMQTGEEHSSYSSITIELCSRFTIL
jgi:hypothetical protein